jgi:hypothetical protein
MGKSPAGLNPVTANLGVAIFIQTLANSFEN